MSNRLAFLGPPGTHTEQAGLVYDPEATLLPFSPIPAVAAAVESGQADECVVPMENSLEGSVTDTLDLLVHDSTLSIRQELVLRISHHLVAGEGTRGRDIRVIYSHPQALAQCRSYLAEHFPDVEVVASLSTAAAVQEMVRGGLEAGAIATERASAIYGAKVLANGIEDSPNNVTRFVVLAPTDHTPTGSDKTSICFSFAEDAPGILQSVLGEFSSRSINLAKIESRPTREGLGRYIFLADLDGHREDPLIKEALDSVRGQVSMFKILGSYPRYSRP